MARASLNEGRQSLDIEPESSRGISRRSVRGSVIKLVELEGPPPQAERSFLLPEGNAPEVPPPREPGKGLEMFLFLFFVAVRSFHPALMDNAKEIVPGYDKPMIPFSKVMPVIGECMISLIVGQLMALCFGGFEQWRSIWSPAPMKVFGVIGLMYAWGDILEVLASSKVEGDAYQVLLQSKLMITAMMMRCIKGTTTSRLQWIILAVVMTAMSVYSTAGKASNNTAAIDEQYYSMTVEEYLAIQAAEEPSPGIDADYMIGIGFTFVKVIVSCLCAVLADKYMKDFKEEPIYVQIVQFKVAWLPMVILYSFFDGETWVNGPMTGISGKAALVCLSFTVKGWSNMYLLALLDSVLKNIGEASSVLVTFFLSIYVFRKKVFELRIFLMVLAVTLSVVSFIESKPVVDKAKKYDSALSP